MVDCVGFNVVINDVLVPVVVCGVSYVSLAARDLPVEMYRGLLAHYNIVSFKIVRVGREDL